MARSNPSRKAAKGVQRTLVLNIGNSTLYVGVFSGDRLVRRFRAPVSAVESRGGFRRLVASRVRGRIERAALCSVIPALTPGAKRRVRDAWGVDPRVLASDRPHGLVVGYRRPGRLGADRIAGALGARAAFPGRNVIVVDCGTATTVTALSAGGVLLGGAILPGLGLWPEMLAARTAQLPRVTPRRPVSALGRSTEEGLRSGFFHGHAGAIRELVRQIRKAAFGRAKAVVIGTGGHAPGFAREGLFTTLAPALVLHGLFAYAHSERCQPGITR